MAIRNYFKITCTSSGTICSTFNWFLFNGFTLQALLPSRKVPLKPLIPGAILIGILLTTLNLAVSKSILSLGVRFQAYGFIGGFLVLTLWVWLLGVIIYFGQCWSVVIASMSIAEIQKNKYRKQFFR